MASTRKSNNAHYRSADLKRPFDNIKEAMGLTGNADSNYYTNLGKVSRYEGSELDNTGKRGTLDALGQVLATMMGPGMERQRYQEHLGLKGGADNYAKSRTTDDLRPDLVRKGGFQADEAGSSAAVAEMLRSLAEQIKRHGEDAPDINDYETGPGGMFKGGTRYEEAIKQSQGDFEELVRKIRAIGMRGDAHKTGEQQAGLVRSTIGSTDALTDQRKASEEAIRNLGVANVEVANKRVTEIAGRMKNAGQITEAKLKEIQENLLMVWQESFFKNGVTLKRGELLDQTIKTELQKTLGAKETVLKKKAETSEATTSAASELTKHWDLPRQLYLKAQKLKQEITKLKAQTATAESNRRVAELTEAYRVTIKKAKAAEAETQEETAGIKQDTATAQKERAVNLASMSKKELAALDPKIKAQAEELQVRIRKGEQQIELAKARTGDVNMARNVKILKKANWNNRNRLQQLLSPYIQQEAKADASNAAGKFAQQTKNIMLKDQLKQKGKRSDEKVNINPEHYSWTDWSNWFDSMDVNKQEYSEISSEMFKHKDKIQSGNFPEAAKNEIIADIIKSLQVEPLEAQKIYKYTLKSFGK